MPKTRAIALVSEGLDGVLAARLLEEQGVEVLPVHFRTGFARGDRPEGLGAGTSAISPYGSGFLGDVVDVSEEYLGQVVLAPKHGYGSAFNPCIDCRIFMLRKADEIRKERGADVLATGEVLGQDRMSQKRAALDTIAREAGVAGVLVRPLSAHHLDETGVERRGAVDRGRLESIQGRARGGQRELAARFDIAEAPEPTVGCCLLADPGFSRRMRDLLSHREPSTITREDLDLLRVGRHFRLAHDLKAIVGRDEAESSYLARRAGDRWTAQVASGHGAIVLVEGELGDEERVETIASLAARYSRERGASPAVALRRGQREMLHTPRPADVERFRI